VATFADYLTLVPAIQLAFHHQGIARPTETQIIGLATELLPIFQQLQKSTAPVPPPVPVPVIPATWYMTCPVFPTNATGVLQPDLPPGASAIVGVNSGGVLTFTVPGVSLDSWGGSITVSAPGYVPQVVRLVQPDEWQPAVTLVPVPVPVETPPHATTGDGTQGNPFVAMSADPTQIAHDVRASMAFFGYPVSDDAYWIGACNHPGQFSNGLWYEGWNKYWEDRMTPGNTGAADPNDGSLPALHRVGQ
jgi:hypothetical protein